MSISPISSTTQPYQPPAPNPVRQNFQQLSQALQSGDLASAQAAYTTLTQNLPKQGTSDGSNSGNPMQQGLAVLGAALQSGNLTGAQSALQTLQGQMKGAHHGHHHHSQDQSQSASSGASSTGSTSSTSSTLLSALSASSPTVNITA